MRAALAIAALSLAACASVPVSYQPIVDFGDGSGVGFGSPEKYQADLADCRQYAMRIDAERAAANNAVAGAIFMGVLSAALGGHSRDNWRWAGAGAVAAGTQGAVEAGRTQVDIIRNCLAGRGYRVLS